MSASIGTASLILSANAEKLQSGLDGAYSKISAWKNSVTSNVSKFNVGGLLGNFGLGKLGVPLAIASGGFKMLGDAVASIKDLSAIGRQAQSLGVSSSAFMALGAAAKKAGLDLPEFGNLLGKMSAKIAIGSEQTSQALGGIGLSLGQLRGMNGADQFLAIADAISKTQNSGTQAAAAMRMFEEAGLRLLPTLQQGGDKLRAFMASQKGMGAALSDDDMGIVQKANAALPKIEAAFTGLWNRVVVAMAPLIEKVGAAVGSLFTKLQPAFDWVARAYTTYSEIALAFYEEVADGISAGISAIADWAAALFDFGGTWPTVGEVVTNVMEFIGKAGAYAFDVLKVGAGAVGIALSLLVDGFGLLVRGIKNLLIVAAELPSSLGGDVFKDAANRVGRFQDGVENAAAGMRAWGVNAITSFGQSAAGVDRFFDKLRNKKKDIDAGLADTGAIMAGIEDKKHKGDDKNGAIIKGSKEDYSINAQIKMEAMKQTDQQKRQITELQLIRGAVDKLREQMSNMQPMPTV
ncbi:phage tail tape measure protein [Limnoglobus roseus]|uniref:Phage tail tape measure protein n=1 Tax=Limnoglobus roseus TaxID=2598579 RepID=A0A5C1A4W4_9BACT|nr:hypothetical protein [Limnoglobus roseus]QEL14149.1 phage tail tape measure protein [Limnoglobus roseus]